MINCIVAIEQNQGIGVNNSLPWPRLSADMQFFKKMTTNQVVIMGSLTWMSLPKKLPDRVNIVITRYNKCNADHCFSAIEAAILFAQTEYPDKEIFIIGGQQLYDSTLHMIDRFYVTEIKESFSCDKFFNFNYVKQNFPNIKLYYQNSENPQFVINEYTK